MQHNNLHYSSICRNSTIFQETNHPLFEAFKYFTYHRFSGHRRVWRLTTRYPFYLALFTYDASSIDDEINTKIFVSAA